MQYYSIDFENYHSSGENNYGHYVIVGSQDIDDTFTIYADQGDKFESTGNNRYGQSLTWDVYSNASYRISGNFNPETMQVTMRGAGFARELETTMNGSFYSFTLKGSSDISQESFGISIAIESKHEENPDEPGPEPRPDHPGDPTTASITVTSSEGHTGSYKDAFIELNARTVMTTNCEPGRECEAPNVATINNFEYNYDADNDYDEDKNPVVYFDFGTLFVQKISKIVINNVEYDNPIPEITNKDEHSEEWEEQYANNQNSCTRHYSHQIVGFTLEVPKDDSYDIVIDVEDVNPTEICISNFLWSNNPEKENEDLYVAHSRLELVRVEWVAPGTPEENEDEEKVILEGDALHEPLSEELRAKGMVLEFDDGENNRDHVGSLVVPAFAMVTMKIVPEYGYQVTSFGMNGQGVVVGDAISEFSFNVSRGNFHIGAVVEATDDEVSADSEAIKSGSIELGGQEITEGTAMLTIGDADLSDEEKEEFQDEAGDYNISTYLSIDLDQIFYDGHDGYWKGVQMKDLNNEATITLELEEGVDGNKVVIVHQKHDGTYEIIPTTYDPETHTITFKTSSFSNYAIASTTVEGSTTPVNTLDDIMTYVVMFVASVICATTAIVAIKKTKQEQ